jgi:hypothetical protein
MVVHLRNMQPRDIKRYCKKAQRNKSFHLFFVALKILVDFELTVG